MRVTRHKQSKQAQMLHEGWLMRHPCGANKGGAVVGQLLKDSPWASFEAAAAVSDSVIAVG